MREECLIVGCSSVEGPSQCWVRCGVRIVGSTLAQAGRESRASGQGDLAPEASERGRPDVEGQVCQGRSTPPKLARVAGVSSENGIRKT